MSWIPKSWTTLPAFHRLLIQPDPSNGLDVTEFCTSIKLMKLFGTEPQLEDTKFRSLGETETSSFLNTIPLGNSLRFAMVHFTTPNGQWITRYVYREMARLMNWKKSGQIWPSGINQVSDKISPWPLQKLCIWKTPLTNIASRWLLIWPISTHGLVATDF
jgi:hypothetical protein